MKKPMNLVEPSHFLTSGQGTMALSTPPDLPNLLTESTEFPAMYLNIVISIGTFLNKISYFFVAMADCSCE